MYDRLNALRNKHGLTYQQLADMSNVPVGTVKSILTGATASPGFEATCAILAAMGESVDAFVGNDVRPTHEPAQPVTESAQVVEHHHHFGFAPVKGDIRETMKEAMTEVYAGEAYKVVHSNLVWWRAIAIALIALVVGWFTWDITHPDVGLIQYGSAGSTAVLQMEEVRRIV